MKVRQWVEFSQEVDVEVSVDDIVSSIIEGDESLFAVIRSFSNFIRFIESVPHEMFDKITQEQRNVIVPRLRQLIQRLTPGDDTVVMPRGLTAENRAKEQYNGLRDRIG